MARTGVSTAPLSRLHSAPASSLLHHPQSHVLLRPPRKALTTAAALPTATDLPPLSIPAAAAAAAALAAAISLSDPERRRRAQAEAAGGSDKEAVRAYFNSTGFERWRKIYGSATEGVNRVQLDIRDGHAQTVAATLAMLRDGPVQLSGATVCDAGCGTGSLAIPLAAEGADVLASDISAAMVSEAQQLALATQPAGSPFRMPRFEVRDLESLNGRYDVVVCLDVLIHYPREETKAMIRHLERLLLSFAPRTLYFDVLKRIGELFPGPSKATRAYLHAERDIEDTLRDAGWRVANRGFISTQFYFALSFGPFHVPHTLSTIMFMFCGARCFIPLHRQPHAGITPCPRPSHGGARASTAVLAAPRSRNSSRGPRRRDSLWDDGSGDDDSDDRIDVSFFGQPDDADVEEEEAKEQDEKPPPTLTRGSQLRGTDVLRALQRAAAAKEAKKNKDKKPAARQRQGKKLKGDREVAMDGEVRPVIINPEWAARIRELELRVQQLADKYLH